MGTYADASDVISRWVGPGAPADASQVEIKVGDAETLVAADFPTLADDVDNDGHPTSEQVKLVVVDMVTRVYRNPEGIRSRTIGGQEDFGGSVTYSGENPGALVITPDERAILAGTPASRASRLGVLQTTRGEIDTAYVTCDDDGFTGSVAADCPYALWP